MEEKKDEISLVELYTKFWSGLVALWRKKWLIIGVGVVAGLIGFTYAWLTPIKYKAKLSFIVEQPGTSSRMSALSGLVSNFGFGSLGGEKGLYDNQANLMSYFKSRSVIEEALLLEIPNTKQTYAQQFASVYGWEEEWQNDPNLSHVNFNDAKASGEFTIQEDSLLFEMYTFILEEELLSISIPDDDGSIIVMDFTSKSQEIAHNFSSTLLDVVCKNYLAAKTRLAKENVEILQAQTDSVRKVLNQALIGSAYATDEVFGLNPAFIVERVPEGQKRVDIQVSSAILEELVKNLEMAKVRLMDQTPLIEVIDRPKYPLEQVKNGKIITSIKFALAGVIVFAAILLIGRMVRRLHNVAMDSK